MRGIAAAVICALAGCGEKALLIEVDTDQGVDGVELFLVERECTDCDGMGPPNAIAKIPGRVFYTDGDSRVYANVDSATRRARFWIEPGTGGDHLLRVVAVGFDNQRQPNALTELASDFDVSAHLGERWNVNLEPRTIALPSTTVAPLDIGDQDGVLLWRPPADPAGPTMTDDHASCLSVKHQDGSHEFIVPPIDADCDNIVDHECDRTWYAFTKPVDTAKVCVNGDRTGQCRIGFRSDCIDGVGQGCVPGSYCIPDGACTADCNAFDGSCLDKLLANGAAQVPRLECTIPVVGQAGGGPPFTPCSSTAQVDGTAFAGCTDLAFSNVATFPPMKTQSVTFGVMADSVVVALVAPTPQCKFGITVATTLQASPPIEAVHPAAFLLTGTQGDTMAIPFVLRFDTTPACDTTTVTTCVFAPAMTQRVWACGK